MNRHRAHAVSSSAKGQMNWSLRLAVAFENITDQDYRVHGSGINEPGFNFTFGAELRF